ncbi:unnamed protein product [Laminaria digitata]
MVRGCALAPVTWMHLTFSEAFSLEKLPTLNLIQNLALRKKDGATRSTISWPKAYDERTMAKLLPGYVITTLGSLRVNELRQSERNFPESATRTSIVARVVRNLSVIPQIGKLAKIPLPHSATRHRKKMQGNL